MKKLMVVAAAIVMAACAQAASVVWTMSNVYSSTDSSTKANSYAVYLFATSNTTDVTLTTTTLDAVTSVIGSASWASDVAALSAGHGNLGSTGAASMAASGIEGISSGTLSLFAIVFDAANITDAKNYYIASNGAVKTNTFTSSTGSKNYAFGTQATASADPNNWQAIAVPEPTSGLLLLLGMAGLALRRKQA